MVTDQADSHSRMCDGSLDAAARMVDRSDVSLLIRCFLDHAYVYECLSQAAIPIHRNTSTPLRASCGALA
jgi:hypothetical protein